MDKLNDFLNELDERKIHYKLSKHCCDYIMVEVFAPGERWEVEFSGANASISNDIRIEKFKSTGEIFGEAEIATLFELNSDF